MRALSSQEKAMELEMVARIVTKPPNNGESTIVAVKSKAWFATGPSIGAKSLRAEPFSVRFDFPPLDLATTFISSKISNAEKY